MWWTRKGGEIFGSMMVDAKGDDGGEIVGSIDASGAKELSMKEKVDLLIEQMAAKAKLAADVVEVQLEAEGRSWLDVTVNELVSGPRAGRWSASRGK